ncbi:MAG: alpha-N-arabinofuranosidase [Longimicrobiales bacterium]
MRGRVVVPALLSMSVGLAAGGIQGQAADPVARIKVDVERTIGEVDPLLFGNFAEHLGRMIYGGIYEEGSPLSDERGFRLDVLEAVKGLDVSILRWPGGNFVSSYDWQDGIGPKDLRPVRAELAWNDLETNRFGTDEFLAYAEEIGAEPYIAVNLGLGTIDDARYWVEYTNESRPTYWAEQRRKNGREEPWGVTYWGLGNEIDGWWQLGQKGPEEYSLVAREAAKAMRRVDPGIKLVASGSSNYGADWIEWNRTVLEMLRDHIDYIGIHTYINNRANDLGQFLAWSERIDHYIEITAGLIAEVRSGRANARPIYIAYDEWNVWYRAFEDQDLEEIYNFEDALAVGMFFNAFFRHADVVKMANLAQMVNVIAPIMTSEEGLFLQPTYFPLVEYGKQRGNVSLDVWVRSPTYLPGDRGPEVTDLDVSATFDEDAGQIFLNVLNRSEDQDITTRIENQAGAVGGTLWVWELNHPDLKATHTFGDDEKVRPETRSVPMEIDEAGFLYTFPAHSLTVLRYEVR